LVTAKEKNIFQNSKEFKNELKVRGCAGEVVLSIGCIKRDKRRQILMNSYR